MNLKAAYRRFKQWQQDPFNYRAESQDTHRCNNCGSEFVGNFCPICSQRQDMGAITWKSVARSIAEVWGLNNRSLVYSVVQLFLRPGYFISDYISGKRQVSFPPVKMLAIIALLGVLVDYLIGAPITGVFNNDFDFAGDKMLLIDNAFEWMNLHPEVMSMILLSYLILPIYFIFRYAPRNTRHTLPQGFFIQVFSATVFLIINMLDDITSLHWAAFVLGNLWLFFAYKQIFGYGWWGTLWRLVLALVCAHLLALIMLGIDFSIHMIQAGESNLIGGFKLFVKLLIRMVTNTNV
ncbi:MAG: DUF3667 domain-containing protein [Muribaculaceae bacterium]|nr:DUF3667 domain-containing protein [Muribaculaceae bacterium]